MTSNMGNLKSLLKKYIDTAIDGFDNLDGLQGMSFFILNGQQDTGKSKLVQDISKDILGQYFMNDFLYIKDFSTQLQKKHNIRVEEDRDEKYKILLNDYNYKDLGTREINNRLQQSPAGKNKILLIENIERMGISAINAFLKTCEEPLPNRIILATTTNKLQILDTVISRAIVIDTNNPYLVDKADISKDLSAVVNLLATDTNIHNKHQLLLDINKKGLINPLLDELIAYYTSKHDFDNAEKRLKIKKMSTSNVKIDNLLFYGLL